jgi:hypothetical protein
MDFRAAIAGLVGQATRGVRTQNPVADYYTRYVGALLERALGSWSAVHSAGVKCSLELQGPMGEHVVCQAPAIGGCMVCGKTVCVGHAMVSPEHIICLGCAYAAKQVLHKRPAGQPAYRAARPPWDAREERPFGFVDDESGDDQRIRAKHLSTLGLGEDATADEIKEAYKRLAKANHPDRAKTDEQRKRREEKLKKLNDAYDWLTRSSRRAA